MCSFSALHLKNLFEEPGLLKNMFFHNSRKIIDHLVGLEYVTLKPKFKVYDNTRELVKFRCSKT